jgi:hypothetical protein
VSTASLWGGEAGVGWGGRLGTLLGPEGTSIPSCAGVTLVARLWLGGHHIERLQLGRRSGCGTRWLWWLIRPYFENCTVDASIFVAKLLRAHGGCLGIRSR